LQLLGCMLWHDLATRGKNHVTITLARVHGWG